MQSKIFGRFDFRLKNEIWEFTSLIRKSTFINVSRDDGALNGRLKLRTIWKANKKYKKSLS